MGDTTRNKKVWIRPWLPWQWAWTACTFLYISGRISILKQLLLDSCTIQKGPKLLFVGDNGDNYKTYRLSCVWNRSKLRHIRQCRTSKQDKMQDLWYKILVFKSYSYNIFIYSADESWQLLCANLWCIFFYPSWSHSLFLYCISMWESPMNTHTHAHPQTQTDTGPEPQPRLPLRVCAEMSRTAPSVSTAWN